MPRTTLNQAQIDVATQTLTGDLTGTIGSPSVSSLNGITVANTTPTIGDTLVFNGTQYALSPPTSNNFLGVTFGDGVISASISAGSVGYIRSPLSGTITSWYVSSDVQITCVVDVWKKVGALPTLLDSIAGIGKPTLFSETTADNDVTGWTTTNVTEGDVIGLSIVSLVGSPKFLQVSLRVV